MSHRFPGRFEEQYDWRHYLVVLLVTLSFLWLRSGQDSQISTAAGAGSAVKWGADPDSMDPTTESDLSAAAEWATAQYWYPGARLQCVGSTGQWIRLVSPDPLPAIQNYYGEVLGASEHTVDGRWLFWVPGHPDETRVSIGTVKAANNWIIDIWESTGGDRLNLLPPATPATRDPNRPQMPL